MGALQRLGGRLVARGPAERDEAGSSARGAQPVHRPVAGDRAQPGAERSDGRIEALGAVPERQEDLLDDVLGDPAVARQAKRRRVQGGGVAIVERGEGVLGPGGHGRDERGLGRGRRGSPFRHRYDAGRLPDFGRSPRSRRIGSGRRSNGVEKTMSVSVR